jgi:hypothetical protein
MKKKTAPLAPQFLSVEVTEDEDETYNGWANYETWNVALWLQNEKILYDALRMYCASVIEDGPDAYVGLRNLSYEGFTQSDPCEYFELAKEFLINKLSTQTHNPDGSISATFRNSIWTQTPDGVHWDHPKLNLSELDRMIEEMAGDDFAELKGGSK